MTLGLGLWHVYELPKSQLGFFCLCSLPDERLKVGAIY